MGSRGRGRRRNSEKRKEKSRDAARSRRNKESEVFYDLANQVPVPYSQTSHLDKASIMRLAISHLKLRKLLGKDMCAGSLSDKTLQRKLDALFPKALDGFMLVMDQEGDMMYQSENISKHLGITQIELIGHSVYDFSHPCDHDEIREVLQDKSGHTGGDADNHQVSFLMRMKCTLTSKGRNINLKSATYKVVHCSGRHVTATNGPFLGMLEDKSLSCLLLICRPIPHPSNMEVPLDTCTFVSRHSMDMKFTYCDDRMSELLGYDSEEIVNHSMFDYHHALDTEIIRDACKNLYSKGQAIISKYRILAQGGGYCWVETEATVITNQRTDKPQCVVCVNYVISGVEFKDTIFSEVQLAPKKVMSKSVVELDTLPSGMILSTESIFAPRPPDADRDMLCITSLDGKEDMLDDLAQLAPSAGDVMMPLLVQDDEYDQGSMMQTSTLPFNIPIEIFCNPPVTTSGATEILCNQQAGSGGTVSTTDVSALDLSYLRSEPGNCNSHAQEVPSSLASPISQTNKILESSLVSPVLSSDAMTSDSIDDIDIEMRAPFITMTGEDDRIFEKNWSPFNEEDFGDSQMLGITESVFAPCPPDVKMDPPSIKNNTPPSILRLQTSQKQIPSVGEIARNPGPPKTKRPMEMNRMETGPPVSKAARLSSEPQHTITSSMLREKDELYNKVPVFKPADVVGLMEDLPSDKGSSVLMNLLTKGEDVNYGYHIQDPKPLQQPPPGSSMLHALLVNNDSSTTSSECEEDSMDDSEEDLLTHPALEAPIRLTTSSNAHGPNIVVIRTNNTVLLAPFSSGMIGHGTAI
uniref:Hypoxia-inducible factor 1 n=1 Tax=Terebellides stroemii TaxID=1037239 RepID=A0AA96HCA9_9ANNE|nr:hypoxia-inducible factor 1 [Terebellides stroemii]